MYEYREVYNDCLKCGKCKPVCTIFNISGDETKSPRGFIDLLNAYQEDVLVLDKNTKDIFESCFLCTNCTDVCPNDLPVDTIIEQVRFDLAKKYGIAWYKKLFFFLLRHRKIMDLMSYFGYMFQSCAIKINKEKEWGTPRFSLPIIKKDRFLPFAKKQTFLNKYNEEINYKKNKRKVAIFIGCMANYSYVNIGDSLVGILKYLDIDTLIPKSQLCCSAPAYFTGDFDSTDYLIKKNIEYFETFIDGVEAIIIPEATCSAMIKEDWERYLYNQKDWLKRAIKVKEKIFMATDWLYKNTDIEDILLTKDKNLRDIVTYHDPCHSRKVQGVYKEPRALLKANYTMEEMSNPNVCCGFGGVTIQSEKYELAKAAGELKSNMINKTNANIVSAECSACRFQITNSLELSSSKAVFKNPLELIYQALK